MSSSTIPAPMRWGTFQKKARIVYGRNVWKARIARHLGVDRKTIYNKMNSLAWTPADWAMAVQRLYDSRGRR